MRIRANMKETCQSHSMSPKNITDTHSLQLAWIFRNLELFCRGAVEDTRLEAKAKDTKKNPRPRLRTAFPRTDTLEAKNRNARGQGQGPRTQAQVLSKKKKKKVFTKIFQAISTKKRFPKNFSSASQNFNNSKNTAVLEPRTGQFSRTSGLEAKVKVLTFEAKEKAKDFKMCPQELPRGQERPRGLHLCFFGMTYSEMSR